MKKLFAFALVFFVLTLGACKKAEEKKEGANQSQAKPTEGFKPQGKKRNQEQPPPPPAIEIYNEANLVKSIPQSDYDTMATAKVKVNQRELKAVLVKDLLSKYNVKGKNVILSGDEVSTALTWDQANSSGLYIYVTPKKIVKVYAASKPLEDMKFPKRLVKITVSATTEAAKPATKPKPTS
jgi:hypothetical protein